MKIKHLVIVGLILAIITIGAVSATEDVDVATAEDDMGVDEVMQAPVDEDVIGEDSSDEVLSDVSADDFYISINDEHTLFSDTATVSVQKRDFYFSGGNISVSVDDREQKYTKELIENDWGCVFNLAELDIVESGNYLIKVQFVSDAQTLDLYEKTVTVKDITANYFETSIKGATLSTSNNVVSIFSPCLYEGSFVVTVGEEEQEYSKEVSKYQTEWSFSLSDLKITEAGEYLIKVRFTAGSKSVDLGEKRITVKEFNKDYFETNIYETAVLSNEYTAFVSVEWKSGITGNITVTVGDNEIINDVDNWNNYLYFKLDDLNITEAGNYHIKVQYISEDGNTVFDLGEGTLNVKTYQVIASIEKDTVPITDDEYPVVDVRWEGDVDGTLYVSVNSNTVSNDHIMTSEESENSLNYNFENLEITTAGKYSIEVKYNDEVIASGILTVSALDVQVETEDGDSCENYEFDTTLIVKVLTEEGISGNIKLLVNDREVALDGNNEAVLKPEDLTLGKIAVKAILSREGMDDDVFTIDFNVVPRGYIEEAGHEDLLDQNTGVSIDDEIFYVLKLPANAKGTLKLYNSEPIADTEEYEPVGDSIVSVNVDGTTKVKIPISKLTGATAHILAVYEDGDYKFDNERYHFQSLYVKMTLILM